mmetsp:Transcript_45993/g.119334  ORF Transcript_45993/g.119334 Transcript_45993/m.119334 type:complete len:294 (+) Transcript_45993:579-1460(+)
MGHPRHQCGRGPGTGRGGERVRAGHRHPHDPRLLRGPGLRRRGRGRHGLPHGVPERQHDVRRRRPRARHPLRGHGGGRHVRRRRWRDDLGNEGPRRQRRRLRLLVHCGRAVGLVERCKASGGQHESLGRRQPRSREGLDRRAGGRRGDRGGGRREPEQRRVQLQSGLDPFGDHGGFLCDGRGQVQFQQLRRLRRRLGSRLEHRVDVPHQRHLDAVDVGHVHGLSARLWARSHHVRAKPNGRIHDRCAKGGSPECWSAHQLRHRPHGERQQRRVLGADGCPDAQPDRRWGCCCW